MAAGDKPHSRDRYETDVAVEAGLSVVSAFREAESLLE
jgi:hypothetical protein